MFKSILEQVLISVVVALILTGLTYAYGRVVPDFASNVAQLDIVILLMIFVIVLGLALFEVNILRNIPTNVALGTYVRAALPYLIAVVLFGALVSRSSQSDLNLANVITIPLIALFVIRLFYFASSSEAQSAEDTHSRHLGFATTSVLILEDDGSDAEFLLIINKNLNRPSGLWLCPGGRFYPERENPSSKLIEKIEGEVGLTAKLIECGGTRGLSLDYDGLSDEGTSWLPAPIFLLRENLGDNFLHGSRQHLDFIYLCRASRKPVKEDFQYPSTLQITVKVQDCMESRDAAFAAIRRSINTWTIGQGSKRKSQRDDIQDDLVLRLHLAARMYHEGSDSGEHSV